jgi:hypothetical protein
MNVTLNLRTSFFLLIILLGFSCNLNDNQVDSSKGTKYSTVAIGKTRTKENINPLTENFDFFFKKFQVDSVFQRSRIVFPLKYTMLGDEGESDSTKYVSKNELKFIKLFISNKDKGIIKKRQISPSNIKIVFQIEDTGYEKDFNFIRKGDGWYLNLIVDSSN